MLEKMSPSSCISLFRRMPMRRIWKRTVKIVEFPPFPIHFELFSFSINFGHSNLLNMTLSFPFDASLNCDQKLFEWLDMQNRKCQRKNFCTTHTQKERERETDRHRHNCKSLNRSKSMTFSSFLIKLKDLRKVCQCVSRLTLYPSLSRRILRFTDSILEKVKHQIF